MAPAESRPLLLPQDHDMLKDRPIWVTIPTIGYSELLIPLLRQLEDDRRVDRILLTVNLEEYVDPIREFFRFGEPRIEVIETWRLGKSLHHGWNTAIGEAQDANAWLGVLNDDIELLTPNAISAVVEVLSNNRDYAVAGMNWQQAPEKTRSTAKPIRQVHGTYRQYGIGGFAWVCDPLKIEPVPGDFEWWYGDDHIVWSAEDNGHKVGIVNHVHVRHLHSHTAESGSQDWTYEARERDEEAFRRIWPGK